MIFIIFFAFIVLIVIGLNMYDNSNLQKIEDYIANEKCESYVYSKGSYKALCKDRLLEIANSFNLDIKKQKKEFIYKRINSIDIEKQNIIINDKEKISFSEEKELNSFYKEIEEKLNEQE